MAGEVAHRPVGVPVVHHGAVITREDHERPVRELQSVKRVEDLADAPVQLLHDVAAHAALAGPREPRMGNAGHVNVVGGEFQEERRGGVPLDERDRLAGEHVGHVFVDPPGGLAPGHVSDPADAAHDRLVVAVAWLYLEQARVFGAGRLVADRGTVTDPDRIARVETDDVMAPDEDARHTVAGRRHDEGLVEADFQGARLDHAVPVDRPGSEPEMPFADDPRRVARPLEHCRQGLAARLDDECGIAGEHARPLPAPRILSREQGVARRRAGRGWSMRVGEPQPLPRQAIDVRRSDPRRAVTADIAIPQVVGIDKHDIRRVGGGSRTSGQDRHEGEQSCHAGGSKSHSVGPVIVNECKGDAAWPGIPSWADRTVRARSRSMLASDGRTPASFTPSPIPPDRNFFPTYPKALILLAGQPARRQFWSVRAGASQCGARVKLNRAPAGFTGCLPDWPDRSTIGKESLKNWFWNR